MTKTKQLTYGAVAVALSTALMLVSKLIPSPWLQGGSVTLASMVPLILISIIAGTKCAVMSCLVYSLIQIMTGFYPPPTQNFLNFVLVILLDYVIAFGVLSFAGFFYKIFAKKSWAIPFCGAIVACMRYICHIVSGMLIWGVYAGEQTVFVYSLTYNGSYMLPEIIITVIVLSLITPFLKKFLKLHK